ncbi:hypothetical protein FOR97_26675 [Bacillus anthracis]|nr:hypothetical protein [Bacillus anthracis]MDR4374810.1 hypothetical protein [Bacillus anthracis]
MPAFRKKTTLSKKISCSDGQLIYIIIVIGSKEKGGNPTLTREPSFLFYGAINFFIHSYSSAVLGFLFVTGFAEKLYKILYTLSLGVFRNAGSTPCPST